MLSSLLPCPIAKKGTPDHIPIYPEQGTQKYIGLIGQSNAAGQVANVNSPYSGVIANAYIYSLGSKVFQPLELAVNNKQELEDISSNGSYGIEIQLMHDLGVHYGQPQYMFKYAYNGTYLNNTNTPNWNVSESNVVVPSPPRQYYFEAPGLYTTCTTWYGIATQQIPIINKKLEWVIWMQGENDANGGAAIYNAYQTNLTNFINNFRVATQLGTNVKFLLVQLSTFQTGVNATGLAAVNTAMQNIAGSLTNVFTIAPNGTIQVDGFHYDAAGLATVSTSVYNTIIAN